MYTDKKKISSYTRKCRWDRVQSHILLTGSSYVTKYLRISSYIRKPFLILYMALHPVPTKFPYTVYKENFLFLSVSSTIRKHWKIQTSSRVIFIYHVYPLCGTLIISASYSPPPPTYTKSEIPPPPHLPGWRGYRSPNFPPSLPPSFPTQILPRRCYRLHCPYSLPPNIFIRMQGDTVYMQYIG